MKTLIIYELIPDETRFFLVDGDKSYLHGHFVNSSEDIPEVIFEELSEPPTDWGDPLDILKPLMLEAGTIIVHCGFVL